MKLGETRPPVRKQAARHRIFRSWWRLSHRSLVVGLLNACWPALAATFTVQNINDTGVGSLRQAILSANTNPGPDTVTFNISNAPPHTIQLVRALPPITSPITIDGTTQPGFGGLPIIELAGGQIAGGLGLRIQAGASSVRGLVISRFSVGGILIEGNGGNVIAGNFIGTDISGTVGLGNSVSNGHIAITNSSGNVIGGTSPTSRNLISGNDFAGVHIMGDASVSNRVQGNFIGTDLTGTNALVNQGVGVFIDRARSSLIGGTSGNARNLISGNAFAGVFLQGGQANVIQGNFIGTDVSGANPLSNGRGILLQNAAGNSLIGGVAAGAGNVVAFNGNGVVLSSGAGNGNAILGNSIFMNNGGVQGFGMGIDLNNDGVTFNDAGDVDFGPNNLQNFPVVDQATSSGSNVTVMGSFKGEPNSTYRLEFFSSPQCSPFGFGEGKSFLGARTVMTDAAGDAPPFTFSFPIGLPIGSVITATATDSRNNTSEFSACTFVEAGPPPPDVSLAVDVSPPGPLVGVAMTYTVTLIGAGQSLLTGVRVTNQLPATVTFVSATPSQGSCVQSNGVVICDIGDFPPSSTPTVEIKVVPNTVGNNTNRTAVGGSGPDADPSNNSVVTVTAIYQLGPPLITKQPEGQIVSPGSNVMLRVNAGPSPLRYQWRRNGANLPGETNDTLQLRQFKPLDGGSYTVVVANDLGGIQSLPAIVGTENAPLLAADNLVDAKLLPASGMGGGNNFGATSEPGEPRHVGKSGGKSVWFDWVASENGIAAFSTTGSTFDTLLAAYAGPSIAGLVKVADDEDSGGFFNSAISFNAVAGTKYHIVVDGFAAQEGAFLLSWQLTPGEARQPEILVHPVSQAIGLNQPAELTVTAAPLAGVVLRYQWFFNGQLIPGADTDKLTVPSVDARTVGSYFARVTGNNRSVDSRAALLQVNQTEGVTDPVLAIGKFRDSVDAAGGGALPLKSRRTKVVAHGFSGTQIFSSVGSTTEPGEPVHCGVIGGASYWYGYQPPTNGIATISTEGSSFNTVLAIYTGPGDDYATLVPLTCDNDSGADGLDSKTSFAATGGTIYWIAVDGVNGGTGTVVVNWNLVQPPGIITQPANLVVTNGSNGTFTVVASGSALAYQWRYNGGDLLNRTNSSLTISNAALGDEGSYAVVITNAAGSITSAVATLTVRVPPSISSQPASLTVTNGGNATFSVSATGTAPLAFQWRFNGSNLSGETGSMLTILTAAPGNEGNYTVVVTNTAGAVTSMVATLTVLVPPAIMSQPASRVVTNGSAVTFTVTATGTPTPGYQWRFNDTFIPGANSASFMLNNVQYTNTGNYVVVASNSAGAATSAAAVLTVLLPLELRWTTSTLSGVRFTVAGSSNVNFTIEASTNFIGWEQLLTTNSSTGLYQFTDTNSLLRPLRFYRALNELH